MDEWLTRNCRSELLDLVAMLYLKRHHGITSPEMMLYTTGILIYIYIPKLLDFRLVKCCNFLTYFTLFNPAIFNKKSIASQRNVRGVCLAFDIQIWLVSNILHPHSGNMILYRSRFSEVGLNYCT